MLQLYSCHCDLSIKLENLGCTYFLNLPSMHVLGIECAQSTSQKEACLYRTSFWKSIKDGQWSELRKARTLNSAQRASWKLKHTPGLTVGDRPSVLICTNISVSVSFNPLKSKVTLHCQHYTIGTCIIPLRYRQIWHELDSKSQTTCRNFE